MKRFGLIILPVFAQSFLLMLPVQATHKEINGCGDDSGLGRFVPNQPVGVDFRPVCDNHDECYGTLGESREHCDNVFRSALRAKCEKTLLRSAGGIFGTVVTGGQALTSCYGVAEAYYRSVRERGGTAYSKAQTHAREELASAGQSQVPADPTNADLISVIELKKLCGRTVYLKSWKGDYLHRSDDNAQRVTTWSPTFGSQWAIECIDNGKFLLKSWKRDYLHRPDDNVQKITTWNATFGSEWDIEVFNDNQILLRSWKRDYLHRPDNNTQKITTWEPTLGSRWSIYLLR
jgi:hypothetical protein